MQYCVSNCAMKVRIVHERLGCKRHLHFKFETAAETLSLKEGAAKEGEQRKSFRRLDV